MFPVNEAWSNHTHPITVLMVQEGNAPESFTSNEAYRGF